MDMFKLLGDIQNNGGLLALAVYLIMRIEYLNRDVRELKKFVYPERLKND